MKARKWLIGAAAAGAVLAVAAVVVLMVPVPGLEGYLAGKVRDQVADQTVCPASGLKPQVTVGGGHLVPQVLHNDIERVRVTVPDVTLSGVPHATFDATLQHVTKPSGGVSHVGRMDATIQAGFANLPAGSPEPTFERASDGSLTVRVVEPASAAAQVQAKLFLSMRVRGETAESVPQKLQIFGRTLPASEAGDLTGGVRKQALPHLPEGVTYRSIVPRTDGLHVALAGTSTTPLSTLPAKVGDHDVSYTAAGGRLGINTSIPLQPIANIPLVIQTMPTLGAGKLTLKPVAVHVLGADHAPDSFLGKLVLGQIDRNSLSRELPALPSGVGYQSVTVDPAGLHVTLGGTTVKPFSSLPATDGGRPTTFGAEGGFLTATAKGGSGDDTPIVLHSKPVIHGRTLDISPSQIEMFGTRFPAAAVLSQVKAQQTAFPLQALTPGLSYTGVDVLPDGLLIHVAGSNVDLPQGALTGGCSK